MTEHPRRKILHLFVDELEQAEKAFNNCATRQLLYDEYGERIGRAYGIRKTGLIYHEDSIESKLCIERWYQWHLKDISYLYNKRRAELL